MERSAAFTSLSSSSLSFAASYFSHCAAFLCPKVANDRSFIEGVSFTQNRPLVGLTLRLTHAEQASERE